MGLNKTVKKQRAFDFLSLTKSGCPKNKENYNNNRSYLMVQNKNMIVNSKKKNGMLWDSFRALKK